MQEPLSGLRGLLPRLVELLGPYRVPVLRGIALGLISATIAFFNLWPQDPGMREIISATVLGGLVPMSGVVGYGLYDVAKSN